jgi:hypothetical protein
MTPFNKRTQRQNFEQKIAKISKGVFSVQNLCLCALFVDVFWWSAFGGASGCPTLKDFPGKEGVRISA